MCVCPRGAALQEELTRKTSALGESRQELERREQVEGVLQARLERRAPGTEGLCLS